MSEKQEGDKIDKFTIVLLGGPAVGKSALTMQMVQGNFLKDYDPTIEDIYTKIIIVDGKECELRIVDTAGNDDFSVLVDGWIGEGDGFLLVFSIIDYQGFEVLAGKRAHIIKVKERQAPPMFLIGNKCDLADQRQVTEADARSRAESWKVEYLETSAKEKINDEEAFIKMIRILRNRKSKASGAKSTGSEKEEKGCCRLL